MLILMNILNNFVVLEGGDGSGTTTQLKKLREKFDNEAGLPILYDTFEPTNSPIGVLIRKSMRSELPLENETIALLFAADRNEHLNGPDGIKKRSKRGELTVCDRYVFSSLVYQGITCGEEFPALLNLAFPMPELTIYLDIDPKTALKRIESRTQREIFETDEFQIRVRDRYKKVVSAYKNEARIIIIDASMPVDDVFAEVWRNIHELPIFKR